MTPDEHNDQRARVAASDAATRHPDTYPRRGKLGGDLDAAREAANEARADLEHYTPFDDLERDFLARLLLRVWERDNSLTDAERALVLELRDRIRLAYSVERARAFRDLTRREA